MQTIRELGAGIWTRPWLAGVLHGLTRLHFGLTYAVTSAALGMLSRLFSISQDPLA